jgi:hypothetical protein
LQPIKKILSCFAPNLTPGCECCVLTYSHHFDVFYMERQPKMVHAVFTPTWTTIIYHIITYSHVEILMALIVIFPHFLTIR